MSEKTVSRKASPKTTIHATIRRHFVHDMDIKTMLRTPLLSSILSFIFLALPVYAETVVSDIDGDGIEDILDNCPSEYNPEQESLFYDIVFLGDACNPDDDVDGVSDEVEDQLEYRDARGEDLEKDANGEVIHTVNTDTDGDGANDIYELNTGTDPFVADNFLTLSLVDYVPLGDIEYTYRAQVTIEPPVYNEEFTETVSEDSPGVYKNTSYALFGEGDHYYRIGKDGIYLKGLYRDYFVGDELISGVEEIDLLHLPFEIQEGGTVAPSGDSKCTHEHCLNHFI
ncbi:MAG: thrombospondin type 3 repeat-containing protein, partial [Pseudomonadota bacterium]|nr:thrombospondin type 3 repeat-containing protein [Pseudomonadota bacterium]